MCFLTLAEDICDANLLTEEIYESMMIAAHGSYKFLWCGQNSNTEHNT